MGVMPEKGRTHDAELAHLLSATYQDALEIWRANKDNDLLPDDSKRLLREDVQRSYSALEEVLYTDKVPHGDKARMVVTLER